MAIEVSTVEPLPLDGAWKHVFFTYDGSGKASGVKIYVNGAPVATRVVSDTLGRATIRTKAPMQLGWRYPDASPSRDTRYQDMRLYGRALAAEEAKRLPFEDYVAEVIGKPTGKWNDDQWHAVSEFYLNSVDPAFRAVKDQIDQLNPQLDKLSKGGAITLVAWERAFACLCQCTHARRVHGAHRTSRSQHPAFSAAAARPACRTTAWRWPNGR